jgi:transcriptional regulator with XRE-family HTH domain
MNVVNIKAVYTHVGLQIKRFREESGLTQDQLAKEIGVSRASLANYEIGKQAIYLSVLYDVAINLKQEIEVFLPSVSEIRSKSRPKESLQQSGVSSSTQKDIIKFIEIIESGKHDDAK